MHHAHPQEGAKARAGKMTAQQGGYTMASHKNTEGRRKGRAGHTTWWARPKGRQLVSRQLSASLVWALHDSWSR